MLVRPGQLWRTVASLTDERLVVWLVLAPVTADSIDHPGWLCHWCDSGDVGVCGGYDTLRQSLFGSTTVPQLLELLSEAQ